jgi:glycosyltransferase involved in cell wall biosynthesis|tara:strand:+ start:194 stop:853 length:660 start_codon:yes stop_codon:yes gene_type:complete
MVDISVIIPYHQDRGYLFDAIESYEAQEFRGTSELVLSHNPTFTLGQNFNAGIDKAKGKYIKILPDDDLLTPNSLQDLFDAAEFNQADLVFAEAYNITDDDAKGWNSDGHYVPNLSNGITLESLLDNNFIHGGTTFYKTSMIRELKGYDESLWTVEEYEFHLRCMAAGYKFCYTPTIVFKYRVWLSSKSIMYRSNPLRNDSRDKLLEDIRNKFREPSNT